MLDNRNKGWYNTYSNNNLERVNTMKTNELTATEVKETTIVDEFGISHEIVINTYNHFNIAYIPYKKKRPKYVGVTANTLEEAINVFTQATYSYYQKGNEYYQAKVVVDKCEAGVIYGSTFEYKHEYNESVEYLYTDMSLLLHTIYQCYSHDEVARLEKIEEENKAEYEAKVIASKIKYKTTASSISIYNKTLGWVEYLCDSEEAGINMFKAEYGDLLMECVHFCKEEVIAEYDGDLLKEENEFDMELICDDTQNFIDTPFFEQTNFVKFDIYTYDIKYNDGEFDSLFMIDFRDSTYYIRKNELNRDYKILNIDIEKRFCAVDNDIYNTFLNTIKGEYKMFDVNAYNNLYKMLYSQYEYLNEDGEFGDTLDEKIVTLEKRLNKFKDKSELYLQVEHDVINNWLYNFRMHQYNDEHEYVYLNNEDDEYDECVDLNKIIFN